MESENPLPANNLVNNHANCPLLQLVNLGCERDERLLFAGINLALYPGEALQILGANGAGKTTLLRVLARISREYLGELHFRGLAYPNCAWELATDSLYLGHTPGIKKSLTPLENLRWYAAQTPVSGELINALAAVGLGGYEDTPCYQLSAGQLRRVALARLHLSTASLWILDEPFTAIDKPGVAALEQLIDAHCRVGGAVVLTSHQDLGLESLRQLDLHDYQPLSAAGVKLGAAL